MMFSIGHVIIHLKSYCIQFHLTNHHGVEHGKFFFKYFDWKAKCSSSSFELHVFPDLFHWPPARFSGHPRRLGVASGGATKMPRSSGRLSCPQRPRRTPAVNRSCRAPLPYLAFLAVSVGRVKLPMLDSAIC